MVLNDAIGNIGNEGSGELLLKRLANCCTMTSSVGRPTVLKANEFGSALSLKLQQMRKNGDFVDCKIRVETSDGLQKEFSAHRSVLACGSSFFRDAFKMSADKVASSEITLKLSTESAASCLEALLDFLYSGLLDTANNSIAQMLQIASMCQMAEAEALLQPYCRAASPPTAPALPALPFSAALFPPPSATLEALMNGSTLSNSAIAQNYNNAVEMHLQLARLTAQRLTHPQFLGPQIFGLPQFPPFNFPSAAIPLFQPNACGSIENPTRKRKKPASQESDENEPNLAIPDSNEESLEESAETFDNMGDIIVPSSDREGWCRNKKYIERVQNGFMCTVCRKVYGRYNSVSYHVTIYHRNPPIKCDEEGCQFSTREARYIHFHKFYRHRIPLPDSIDLGSRKCPFCRHISKSPAMLEKHISRHMSDCTRSGSPFKCPQCEKKTATQKEMLEHMLMHQEPEAGFPCEQCSYRGQSEMSLRQHVLFKHSADMFSRKITCELCPYACAEPANLKSHYERMHPEHHQAEVKHEENDDEEESSEVTTSNSENMEKNEENLEVASEQPIFAIVQ